VAEWTSSTFHDEVRSWVAAVLAPLEVRLTGEWSQPHARLWSSAIRLGTSDGPVWFKVNAPGTRQEPGLLSVLAACVPSLAPQLLAVDLGRGWSLTRDAGPVLRAVTAPAEAWPLWEELVRRYAEAQAMLAAHREQVLAAGVRALPATSVPARARTLMAELSRLPEDDGGLSRDQQARLTAALPALDGWCAELAASAVPDSVQHDDLHAGNVCWPGAVAGREGRLAAASARVIDWGDASWGCPLATMLTTMRSLAYHAGLGEDAGAVLRVRDAYLEAFTVHASRAELLHLLDLARRVGCVSKALSWRAGTQGAPVEVLRSLEFPVREWLLELADR
jgi:hypothetical protein